MASMTKPLEALGGSLLMKFRYLPGLIASVIGFSLTATASPSNLDPTFGVGGKVVSSPDGSEALRAASMALQSDGKIVMVASRIGPNFSTSGFIVARYNSDGSLDTTFGNNGWSETSFGAFSEYVKTVVIQSDGKIVVGGGLYNLVMGFPFYELAFVRFDSTGAIDTTFGGDGKVTIDFRDLVPGLYLETVSSLKTTSDGKIVVGGYHINAATDSRIILARMNSDGSLDTTFGTNGRVLHAELGMWDLLIDLVVLPDGAIVAAGYSHANESSTRRAIKYNINGGVEWSYEQTVQGFGILQRFNSIAALPDGKFIVVGHIQKRIVAMRLNADGTEDNTFISAPGMPEAEAISVAIQSDGKIVANITNGTPGSLPYAANSFSLVRYNANGSVDSSFGNGGIARITVTNGADYGRKVLIQPDGKTLVGGYTELSSPTRYYFTLVRYMGTFTSSATLFDYDNDGKADVSVFRPSQNRWFVFRSSDAGVTQPFFGAPGDIPTPADFDGDGRTDIAIFRPSSGDWWYLNSNTGIHVGMHWGTNGDIPLPSDVDGDGKADYVVYHPANNYWYRLTSGTGEASERYFGTAGDKPLIGDFDGDGKADPAVFRPSTGVFWYMSSIDSVHRAIQWGISTDIPVPADYDGDGKTDAAVCRKSTGTWYILNSSDGSLTGSNFGLSEDQPVPADYDGDAKADIAVFRPSNGTWYLQQSTAGFAAIQWGAATDIPTENAFIP